MFFYFNMLRYYSAGVFSGKTIFLARTSCVLSLRTYLYFLEVAFVVELVLHGH